jgi:hypothetical protein
MILESLQRTTPASHSANLNGTRCSMVRALIQLGDFREALAALPGRQHPLENPKF